jgi:hypothetical protein
MQDDGEAMTDPQREAFEKAFAEEWGSPLTRSGTGYSHGITNSAWWAWQAATASHAATEEEVGTVARAMFDKDHEEAGDFRWGDQPPTVRDRWHSLARAALAAMNREWRCFHCGEVFTDPDAARDHFGTSLLAEPVCQIPDLAHLLRLQEDELQRFREEDSAMARQFHALGTEHYRKEREAEEKGYARGLSDGRDETEELVKRIRYALQNDVGNVFVKRAAIVDALQGFPE